MAAKRGRLAAQRPATAYDYRRVIALVQALALRDYGVALYQLAEAWGVEIPIRRLHPYINLPVHDMQALVHELAKHALESARKKQEDSDGSAG